MTTPLYPVFLKLAGLPVVVVGGGTVAAGKLDGLLAADARVTVIAPVIADAIHARVSEQLVRGDHKARGALVERAVQPIDHGARVILVERAFAPRDLDGARWVIAAATPAVNRAVAIAAAERGLFVNAVDDTASASAYLGGVVRRGPIEISISTGGLAPALAGLVREALDALLPDEIERWFEIAAVARADWKRANIPIAERRPLLLRALDRLYAGAPT